VAAQAVIGGDELLGAIGSSGDVVGPLPGKGLNLVSTIIAAGMSTPLDGSSSTRRIRSIVLMSGPW
jgi:hypothetical protein